MAYSTSPITVERMLPYMEPLAEGRETVFRTEPGRSRWLAYKLREALAIAQQLPERYPRLAALHFRFEVHSSREVRAVPRADPEVEVLPGDPRPLFEARVETTITHSAESISARWTALSPTARSKLYFPNAGLSLEELRRLWTWAQNSGVLLFENLGAITLLPVEGNEEAAEYAWSPEGGEL